MVNIPKIDKLITKYLTKSITLKELDELYGLINTPNNHKTFEDYILINYAIDHNFLKSNIEKTKTILLKRLKQKKNKRNYLIKPLKYAAVAFLVISLGIYLHLILNNNNPKNELIIDNNAITITKEDGKIEIVNANEERKILNKKGNIIGLQNKNRISYKENKLATPNKKITYNTISVPYGKTFQIQLSDGTVLSLNSGTSVKYPVNFIYSQNTKRQLYLLSGEVFLEVAKDQKHPFILTTNSFDITVYGTSFNVSAFPEDEEMNTVLVEGSIKISGNNSLTKNINKLLKPGFKAAIKKGTGSLKIEKVDTSLYTAWKTNKLIFRNVKFKNIIKKLERKYNVTIVCNKDYINYQYYNATFDI